MQELLDWAVELGFVFKCSPMEFVDLSAGELIELRRHTARHLRQLNEER